MGHYYSEIRGPRKLTLLERIEEFTSDNREVLFTLTIADEGETLVFRRAELVELLSKVRKDQRHISEVRTIFHELAK